MGPNTTENQTQCLTCFSGAILLDADACGRVLYGHLLSEVGQGAVDPAVALERERESALQLLEVHHLGQVLDAVLPAAGHRLRRLDYCCTVPTRSTLKHTHKYTTMSRTQRQHIVTLYTNVSTKLQDLTLSYTC